MSIYHTHESAHPDVSVSQLEPRSD